MWGSVSMIVGQFGGGERWRHGQGGKRAAAAQERNPDGRNGPSRRRREGEKKEGEERETRETKEWARASDRIG